MSRGASAVALLGALSAAAALAGCGGPTIAGDQVPGRTLTIYSSLPLHGAGAANGRAVLLGEQLALARWRGMVGHDRVVLRALDDSTPQRGEWDPGQTTLNARAALDDRTTIGYIGELNSGASAISIPLLNREHIPQVGPASTAVGLTSSGIGASPGEPEKYYPTGARTYVRVMPSDAVQARAQVQLQKQAGCRSTYVLDDGGVDGEDLAASFAVLAAGGGLQVSAVTAFDPRATDYGSLVAAVVQSGARCALISAIGESSASLLSRQLTAAAPSMKLFASAGLADSAYVDPAAGGIPVGVDRHVLIMVPTGPAPVDFYSAYARAYGSPQPVAIYGYESMSLMLDAISRATRGGTKSARRSKVLAELFATHDRRSALGTYAIDHNGDTTARFYGIYRVVDGRLRFLGAISG